MEIRVKLREVAKMSAKSKAELVRVVNNYGLYTISPYGTYISPLSRGIEYARGNRENIAYVANYQLIQRKTKQIKDKNYGVTKSVVIREKAWTVRIFAIPTDLLKVANVKVVQKSRHFEFEKR